MLLPTNFYTICRYYLFEIDKESRRPYHPVIIYILNKKIDKKQRLSYANTNHIC